MSFTTIGKRWSLVALVAGALLAGDALAQRGERGRGGGDRGGGDGRGGGGSSFRSGGGGEGRSFRGGDRGGRSFSRSMQGRSERSISRGAPRGESFRSMDGGRPGRTSFQGGQSRESVRTRSPGSFDAGRSADRPSDLGTRRTFSRERSQLGQQFDRQRSFRSRDDGVPRTARSQREAGQNRYQTNRPTDDQVRDFLRMPQDGQRQQPRDLGDRSVDRDFRARDQLRRDLQQRDRSDLTRRSIDADRRGDLRDRTRDFVDRDGRDRDLRDRDFRDRDFDRRDFDRDYDRWRRNVWTGDDRRGRDDRDWSGRWREGRRFDIARQIRNRWRDRDWDDDDFPFRFGWWGGRDWRGHRWDHWDHWARSRPFYWWYWATAPRLSNWIVYRWGTPYYWDYGPGEYIYYDDGAIYVNGRWHQPAPVFYENTVRLVEEAPDLTAEEAASMEWLPLGVFAVTRDGQAQAEVLVQLAVTQEGVIAGTASDQRTGASYAIEGTVEKQSQRAVWSYTDARGQRVVMETSIFNLTQPEATGLVHYGPESIEVIELVRLEPPDGASVATGEGELPTPGVR